MLYEEQNKSASFPDFPVLGELHEKNQVDLAQWALAWIDRNWIGHPEIVSWKVSRYIAECGHTSAVIRVMFKSEEDSRIELSDLNAVESSLYEELRDHLSENFGTYGFLEGDEMPVRGNVLVSDTLRHVYVVFKTMSQGEKEVSDILQQMKNGGISSEDFVKLTEALRNELPSNANIISPSGSTMDALFNEDDDD